MRIIREAQPEDVCSIPNPNARGSIRLKGRMRRSPFAGRPSPGELATIPSASADPDEYATATVFEQHSTVPVLLNYTEHYAFIAGLVRTLRERFGARVLIVVRMCAPNFMVPLPPELLADDLVLVHEPAAIVDWFRAAGRGNIIVIEDDLRRDGFEVGNNDLSLSCCDGDVAAFIEWARSAGLKELLDDVSLTPIA